MQRYFERVKYLQSFICMLLFSSIIFALPVMGGIKIDLSDTSLAVVITRQINAHKNQLTYPLSITRFYKLSAFRLMWIAPNTVKTHAADAMMLLDCVVQYGLNHADYHPLELQYGKLNDLINHPDKNSIADKAAFDIFLTDAMISFINNLHYGKLNPVYTTVKIDVAKGLHLDTELTLLKALKSPDFNTFITGVQPTSIEYKNLKYQMYLVTGLYILDCYETPEADIRKMAVNMERLRWIGDIQKPYILVNTATGNLRLYEQDSTYKFKLFPRNSSKLPIEFISKKLNGQVTFGRNALTVKSPGKLAKILLAYDRNSSKTADLNIKYKKIRLNNPVNVNTVYLTCEVIEGTRVFYNDILNLDKELELQFYRPVSKR